MTPDMQRLCEAAETALEDIVAPDDLPKRRLVAEAVVSAVLAELRAPSDSMCVEGGTSIEESVFNNSDPNDTVFDGAGRAFTVMIDRVLNEDRQTHA